MAAYFINRPVLSLVISILIVLLGLLGLTNLPVTLYPEIAPPEVTVTSKYTGANAEACTKAVVTPLERSINGVPGMQYMSSVSGNDGKSVIQVIFKAGTDPEIASVNVQNRVASVMNELPEEAIKSGIIVEKVQNSMLLYLNIFSEDSLLDEKFLYNFVDINILPELKRIDGVGFVDIMGSREYAMRVWLKPDKMAMYGISAQEVVEKLKRQNVEAAPGKLGESSGKKAQSLQFVLRYTGKYNTREAYENMVIKSQGTGELIRLREIAEVDFDSQDYDVISKENGKPSAAIMLKQRPGSNAKEVIANIKLKMQEMNKGIFLPGMTYTMSYDVSQFLDASIHEVIKTLLEAFLLVALVVFIFLQDLRSTIIPAIAVPVSLVGTFFFMDLMGFSLNMITLFALVLAIGIVVDDAIVVVEAVHAKMEEGVKDIRQATEQAVGGISKAIIAITLVMSAVFLPTSFMSGPTGIFFKQFSLTMAVAIALSGLTALTLTPSLCVLLLKSNKHEEKKPGLIQRFFHGFNSMYEGLSGSYLKLLKIITNRRVITVTTLLLFSAAAGITGKILPSGFIPEEDQGTIYANIETPAGATLERTEKVVNEVQNIANEQEGVNSVSSLCGYNILTDAVGAIYGMNLISLKNWEERDVSDKEIITELKNKTKHLRDAKIEFFTPPPVPGYGNASGFEFRLLDKTGSDNSERMQQICDEFVKELNKRPELENVFTTYNTRFPQYLLRLDNDKAAQKGIDAREAMSTLQTFIGSEYATNFIRFGQLYRVMAQALPSYRAEPNDILIMKIKNASGELVPYSAFMRIEKVYGAEQVVRYNMFNSAMINGQAAKGYSSGDALTAIKEVAEKKLPRGFGYGWAGPTLDQAKEQENSQSAFIFVICLLFVYLLLSAQYESFLLPFAIILSLPVGIFGAFLLLSLLGLENNIYAQVALIMLIGILGKNAILIVEFANAKQKEGSSILEAVYSGALARLRPILMTSFAFIAGLLPLVFASSAGEIGNRTIGTAAAGGMLFGTCFGVIVIPGLYIIFAGIAEWMDQRKKKKQITV